PRPSASTSPRSCASGPSGSAMITASRSSSAATTCGGARSCWARFGAQGRASKPTCGEPMAEALLSVRDLAVSFATAGGILQALDGISFDVLRGRTVALVGESGCGKSVTAQAILRLLQSPPGRIDRGAILLEGRDLFGLSERDMRAVRGGRIGIVFQDPMT